MKSHTLLPRLVQVAFWGACLVVGVLSLLPVDELPPMALSIWDKAQHALGFLGLAVLGLWGYGQRRPSIVWGLLAYGALIEVAQAATGWRTGDVLDWLADATGILFAAALVALWQRRRS